ncbi:MAG: hypothetical protein PHQ42_00130 [Patescibacteria group bacterium]|nr:hypothetical protein [Patescibacteria group bacterium]
MADRVKKIKLKVKVQKTPKAKAEREIGRAQEKIESREKSEKPVKREIGKPRLFQDEKIERDKKLMMWAGVSFFMVLIFAGWVLNMRSVFRGAKEARNNYRQFEWDKLTGDFGQTIEQIKKGLEELKQVSVIDNISTSTENNLDESNLLPNKNADFSSPEAEIKEENLEELKNRLKELEEEIENNK